MKRFSVGLTNAKKQTDDQLETLSSARSSIANTNTNDVPHYTLNTHGDLVSKAIQSHGIERKSYFRSTSLQTKLNVEEKPQAEPPSNYSITQIDNNLVRIPVRILEMKNILNILDLSRNKFEYFPLEIVQIHGLRSLKMDYNKIKYLPSEISKLSNLEIFSISNNYIPNIPPSLPQLSRLRSLNVECNRIDSFSHEVTGLRCLESLNIMRNRLANFPCSFKDLTKLTEFHFEWFRYTVPIGKPSLKIPEDENKLAKLLEKCTELYKKNILTFSFVDFLSFFTQDKVNIKAVDTLKGRSMLHQAVMHEDISVIRYIIPSAPDLIDQIDRDKMTPLCLSLVKEKFRSSIYLLKHGANPTKSSHSIGSPIHIATKKLNFPIVREILRLGESLNKTDIEGNTCLHIAMGLMCEGEDPEKAKNIVEYLLEKGANPNIKNKEGWTPAHIAARKKNNECVKWALSYNFEINEILGVGEKFDFEMKGGVYSWTAAHIAAYADSPDVLMSLGEAGIDMFKKSKNGFTPKRVINKTGLGLRLIQKYEKQQIKNMIFTKKQLIECPSSRRKLISDPAYVGGVRIASGGILAKEACEVTESDKKYGYKFSTKLKKNAAPFMNSERTPHKKRDEKSPEPEEDISSDEESANPSSLFDISIGLDEDISIIVDPYTKDSGFKNVLQKKERQSFHKRYLTENGGGVLQEQWLYNDEPELPDLSGYEEALKKEEFFGIDYCKDELKTLKESLTSENLGLSEKLKVFTALKILHKAIIEWIYKKYAVRVRRQDFCYFIFKENVQKANIGLSERSQTHLKEMINICELIPQCLVSVYVSLGAEKFENFMLKGKICEMLGDLQNFAAIEFLNNIMMNPLENPSIKKQAQRVYTMLMGQLQEGKNVKQQTSQGLLFGENQNNQKDLIGIKLNNVIANYEKTRLSAGLQSKMV